FYINIPFGILAAILVTAHLHERIERKPHDLDFAGAALLTAGVSAILLASNRLGLGITIAGGASGAALLVAFYHVERRAPDRRGATPLFARPVILLASVTGATIGGAMMAIVNYVPLYVQGALHLTATQAGTAIAPMLVGWPVASTIGGRLIPKVGFRPL